MVGLRHTCLDECVAESEVFEMVGVVVVGWNGEEDDGMEWK